MVGQIDDACAMDRRECSGNACPTSVFCFTETSAGASSCDLQSGVIKGSSILVTGGAGYIGSHTVHLLLKQGYDVTVVDNLSRGYRHNVPADRLRIMDLADTEGLSRLFSERKYDAVVHFAAYIAVGESMRIPEVYFTNNVAGSLSLLTAMIRSEIKRIVFSSTAAVYGTPARVQ